MRVGGTIRVRVRVKVAFDQVLLAYHGVVYGKGSRRRDRVAGKDAVSVTIQSLHRLSCLTWL